MRKDIPEMHAFRKGTDGRAIEFRHVTKAFHSRTQRVVALDAISLRVKGQGITGLVGPDAAGKTTLMRLAAALLFPDEGEVDVLGMSTRRNPQDIQCSISYMPQQFGLYEDLSVMENLNLYADLHGTKGPQRTDRFEQLLRMAGLDAFKPRRAGHLSGGMKEKLGLACAFIGKPRLLLLDEPTAGVDPLSRRELWQIMKRLVEEEEVAVLVSTAYLDEAERCDEVVMLHEGRILSFGPPRGFLDTVKGRVFRVHVPGFSRPALAQRLRSEPRIVEASVGSAGVRVLTVTGEQPSFAQLLSDVPGVQVEPAAPCFEDSFIAALRAGSPPSNRLEPQAAETRPSPASGKLNERVVIDVRDVSRCFGSFYAVRDVSFKVRPGETFGLLGANGAGKSTTFRMLCGLLPPTAGRLLVAGVDLRQAAATARRRIGYMAQKFSLYGKLSVYENLKFFSSAYGLAGFRQRKQVAWALEQFALSGYAQAPSLELPLGYRQRLAMACALMHEPDIVFLDEPTSGVDPLARREFWDYILQLAARGVTIMVTTHFMNEAEYCDRVAIMNAGRILAIDTPEAIRQRARTDSASAATMEDAFVRMIEEARDNHA